MEGVENQLILYEKSKSGIAYITLNRPDMRNAMTLDMYREVASLMDACSMDQSVRAVVITGTGKHFCAGGDIQKFKRLIDAQEELPEEGIILTARMAMAVRRCEKPVIAKINGAAVGAGCALAMACDFRIMAENSRLVSGFLKMGFSGDTLGWYWLSQMIGIAKTSEFYMTGGEFKADEALKLGICNRVVSAERLDSETEAYAEQFLHVPTKAIGYQKRMYNQIVYPDMERVLNMEREYMTRCSRTKDHKEAVYAFLEKRLPIFTGE